MKGKIEFEVTYDCNGSDMAHIMAHLQEAAVRALHQHANAAITMGKSFGVEVKKESYDFELIELVKRFP